MHFFVPKFQEAPDDEFSSHSADLFYGAEYHIELDTGEKIECRRLGWAALNRSITLGLNSSDFWGRLCYDIEEESLEYGLSRLTALCVTNGEHVSDARVQTWIAVNREFEAVPEPTPCALPYEQRVQPSFNVPHHDNEKLKAFSDKIVRHKYVCGVVDTLEFDPTTSRFIVKWYEDGKVDVRLHWTRTGCGLRIQTVGKGLQQTELIARRLEDKFDRRS